QSVDGPAAQITGSSRQNPPHARLGQSATWRHRLATSGLSPNIGHWLGPSACPKSATSRRMRRSKMPLRKPYLLNHLISPDEERGRHGKPRETRSYGSVRVAPRKRVELSRLRSRPRQSLASSRVPSLAWRPVTAAAKRSPGGCRPERQ